MAQLLIGIVIGFSVSVIYFYRHRLHASNSGVEKRIIRYDSEKQKFYNLNPEIRICPSEKRVVFKGKNFYKTED